jgi:predicted secreted Zn-dependent protease
MSDTQTKTSATCIDCGNAMTSKHYTHYEVVGTHTVKDETGFALTCQKCGATEVSLEAKQHYELAAANAVLHEGIVTGDVFRYARKAIGLTQKELGLLLDYRAENISRHENTSEEIARTLVLAIRSIVIDVLRGAKPEDLVAEAIRRKDGDGSFVSDRVINAAGWR